jgi:DNA-binding HxlR family transcriptional regulator
MHESIPPVCQKYHRAVELIGRRWAGAIIQALLPGQARYASIRDAIPEISDRMLSERLRELESEGLLVRQVFPETPVRVEYALTEKGRALEPALVAIGTWAAQWGDGVPETRDAVRA